MIIAVSDLHLGDSHSNEKGFLNFIQNFLKPNQEEITHLVLLGDILDFWGKNTTVVMQDHSHIFDAISSLDFETHYLVGNHDFALTDPRMVFRDDITVGKDLSITDGITKLRFVHGHQLSYWYALSFYEFFSHAMCYVTEDDETSALWAIFQNNLPEIPTSVKEKANSLSEEKKRQIEKKLAGPLIGQEYSVTDAFILEHNLLSSFVDFKSFQTNDPEPLLKEMQSLSAEVMSFSRGEVSQDVVADLSLHNIAYSYLTYWLQICEWSIVNNEGAAFQKIIGQMKRIASMFSIGLESEEFLIHGHGHEMMIDQENRIADTGCWIGESASYVSINDGIVSCARWPKR